MPKQNRRHQALSMLGIMVITLAAACSYLQKGNTPTSVPQFNNQPDAVIIFVDIHYPGVPLPTRSPNDRYCAYLPSLRVWGDGLAFLDEGIQNEYSSVLSGNLDQATLQKLLEILNADNFFASWKASTPYPVNPSGTSLKIGAQLKDKPVIEYTMGALNPPVYEQLLETIKPVLKPLAEQSKVDERILEILKEDGNCNKYF